MSKGSNKRKRNARIFAAEMRTLRERERKGKEEKDQEAREKARRP